MAEPHYWSDNTVSVMTDAEVTQELTYNELGGKLCGWKPTQEGKGQSRGGY